MCGIAGYAGTRTIAPSALAACLERLRRRGPDAADWKHWTTAAGRQVYLLNTRLSIIDLDARANQPFTAGSRTLTYNGEIYNYLEVRRDLCAAGDRFATASDTEVLLAAFARWGDGAWDRLEGMWAAAIYDDASGALTICRDRFGEKPLFVLEDATGFYFASEPKAIAALRGSALPVDLQQVRRFLVNGYRSLYKRRETFFDGLRELPPATWIHIDADGSVSPERVYWQPRCVPDETMSFDDAAAGVRARLRRAVELRLRADVPMAFCLSGGVDSNALASIASRDFGVDVHAFTVVDDDPRYDERAAVRASAAELGIAHTEVPTSSAAFLDQLRALVDYHDAPVLTISYVAHAALMQAIAARGCRVAVSGTAADEIFSGYYDHHLAYLASIGEGDREAARRAWAGRVRPLVRNPFLADPDLFVRDPAFRGHLYLDADRYAACLTSPWAEPFEESAFCADLLRNRMLNELRHETVPVILHEDDANAMCWSIENRSPYLDRPLVDFCATIPTRHLVRGGFAKAVLREAVRGIAPRRVLDDPRKVGFNAPIASYLDVGDPEVRGWLLGDSPIYELVRRPCIAGLIDRPSLPNSDSKFLFAFVSSKMFLERFAA